MSDDDEKPERGPGRFRFVPLLVGLGVFFLTVPLLAANPGKLRWIGITSAVVLALAIYAVSRSRRLLWIGLALGGPAMVAKAVNLSQATPTAPTMATAAALTALFLAYTSGVIYREVVRPGAIDADKISGAVAVYLLLGLIGSFLFTLVETVAPGSFHFAAGEVAGRVFEHRFLYFSFVTLTTLGYGDVTPATPFAQTLSWIEAVVGQLFLAVTVATLVGLRISRASTEG